MKRWTRPLVESLVVGSVLALLVVLVARAQMFAVLDWIGPVFILPFHVSAMLTGNAEEPAPWLFHTMLFLQFCLAVFIAGWLVGRYRRKPAKA